MAWMGRGLTEKQIVVYMDAFLVFDPKRTGNVYTKELGAILKYLGVNPTKEELQDFVNIVDYNCNGKFQFPELLDLMANLNRKTNYEAEVEEAFRFFDRVNKILIIT